MPLAEAIHLLSDDGPVNHIAAIRPYIDHQDPAVKAQAAIALCVDPQTRPKIVAMVTDSRTPREVRVMGLRGLARNDDRFAEYAIGIVQDAKADPEVRQAAMLAFAGRMNYNKVDDRTQVRFAEAVKRIAGDARSPKTLQAAAIRVARVPGKGLSGGRANEMIPRAVLLCGLCAFANAGSDAVPAIRQALSASNGATDHLRVAALLDQLRSLGGKAAPAGDTLSAMLAHRHPLYRGRDKAEVTRLRTHLYVTLSEIGVPASAIPPLLDTLAHFDTRIHPGEYGAAVRAVAALGPNGRRFIAYLLPALVEPMSEDEFSLVRYEPGFERHEATTIQLEIARCLGAVASRDDQEALRTLRELAQGAERTAASPERRSWPSAGSNAEPRRRRKEQGGKAMRVETNQVALLSFVLLAGAACTANRSAMPEREAAMFAGGAPEESELATPWIAPAGRRRMKYLDIGYTDQDGRRGTIGGLVNKPVLLTFFYSRCQNGAKCSMAVSRMASLQRSLAANGLDKKVRLLAVSYEPQFDTPDRIHRFGTDRGMQFGENAQALRLDPARLQQLIDEIEAPVNYNSGWVNTHGIELSLIDGSPDGSSANITPCCGTTNSCSVT